MGGWAGRDAMARAITHCGWMVDAVVSLTHGQVHAHNRGNAVVDAVSRDW